MLESRTQDSDILGSLTEPLKKRGEWALAGAKKVSRIWCVFDREDKRPQHLIKRIRAYLDGKISAEALSTESSIIEDFMSIVDEEDDSATAAALAVWKALMVALEDEFLLEPWYDDSTEYELKCLTGLTRPEAICFQAGLEAGGVKCRILPAPIV